MTSINKKEYIEMEEDQYTLIDALPQFVWISRPDGSLAYANQRWRDYSHLLSQHMGEQAGFAHEQLDCCSCAKDRQHTLPHTGSLADQEVWLQNLHPEDRERVLALQRQAFATGEPYAFEYRLRDGRTGAYRWFLSQHVPLRNEAGQIVRWVATCTDIDDQKRTEQQLKASEQNWRVLAETVPHLVWAVRSDGCLEYANQHVSTYLGAVPEYLLGEEWRQFVHPDDYERVQAARRRTLETGEPYEGEYRLKEHQTGRYRWFLGRIMPVRDETGQIVKRFGTATDIDEEKRAEHQLKESWERLRVLTEMVPQLVWVKQPDGQFEYVNQRWCDYIGLTLEHVQSDRWAYLQCIHPDDRESNRALVQHALETGETYEYEGRVRQAQTGEYRWFLVRALPVRDETGQIVKWFGTSTYIEEQKCIEEALRQSQERVNALMNSSIIGIDIAEGEQIVDANDAFLHMTGYTREDLHAGRINWMQMTPPEYLTRTLEACQELTTQRSTTPYEKEYVCKDGSRLPVLVGLVDLPHHPSQAIVFVLDNSARKELEQRKDDFISMASHELRNPLAALKLQTILLHRQLARQGLQAPAPALSSMETQINKLTRLVEELLDVSKIQAGKLECIRETVDLDALLRESADTIQQIYPSHCILVRCAARTSLIGDRDRLGQVFTNLLCNAIKYSPDAETVEMDLSASEEAVTIRVRDHGLGIPREQCDKIFERFYRVTGSRQRAISGLGMGLYIVAEIIKGHGGIITVDSEVGKGSTFTVTLPKRRDA